MRLFVAVYPPEEALEHLAAAVAQTRLGIATAAGSTVGLTARERWHLTLAFLGDVPEERVPAAEAALPAAADRWRADGRAAPAVRLAGAGRFGRRRFTVLWVGMAGEVDALRDLGRAVRRELRRADLPYDGKPLRPHLTIARPGERLPAGDVAADVQQLVAYQGPVWTVDALHLVASNLGPQPAYRTLSSVGIG